MDRYFVGDVRREAPSHPPKLHDMSERKYRIETHQIAIKHACVFVNCYTQQRCDEDVMFVLSLGGCCRQTLYQKSNAMCELA